MPTIRFAPLEIRIPQTGNPNSEYRNPKQIPNPNFPMFETRRFFWFRILNLGFVSNFVFRISNFE